MSAYSTGSVGQTNSQALQQFLSEDPEAAAKFMQDVKDGKNNDAMEDVEDSHAENKGELEAAGDKMASMSNQVKNGEMSPTESQQTQSEFMNAQASGSESNKFLNQKAELDPSGLGKQLQQQEGAHDTSGMMKTINQEKDEGYLTDGQAKKMEGMTMMAGLTGNPSALNSTAPTNSMSEMKPKEGIGSLLSQLGLGGSSSLGGEFGLLGGAGGLTEGGLES